MDFLYKVYSVIKKFENYKIFFIFFLMFIITLLEMLSIGSLVPLMNFLVNPSNFENLFKNYFNVNNENLLIFLVLIVFIVYLFKSIFIMISIYIQNKFSIGLYEKVSNQLFQSYINRKYEFFLKNEISELTRNLKIEVHKFIFGLVLPLFSLLIEIFTFFGIFILLVIINYKISLLIFLISSALFFLYSKATKGLILELGVKGQRLDANILSKIKDSIEGIREIKILGLENIFFKSFSKEVNKIAKNNLYYATLQALPKQLIETFAILLFSIVIILSSIQYGSLDKSIALLGIYAAAALRILPSFTRIIYNLQVIRYNKPAGQIIFKEFIESNKIKLQKVDNSSIKKINFKDSFELNNISYKYKNLKDSDVHSNKIIKNLNLKIKKGSKIGIFGNSGCGKSTLLDIITGLIIPDDGQLIVEGKNLKQGADIIGWQKNISYVHQKSSFFNDTIKNNIIVSRTEFNENFYKTITEMTLVNILIEKKYNNEDTLIGDSGSKLSGGEKQKIAIARSLYKDSNLIILDEATNALDETTEIQILENIFKNLKEKTIIVVSHNKNILKFCETIYQLKNGSINSIK